MRMKTAVTVLQEKMVKLGEVPEYECIAKSGPAHQANFTVQCRTRGVTVAATARSKREAKQEAARLMLERLAAGAVEAPRDTSPTPGSASPAPVEPPPGAAVLDARTHVALLAELCDHIGLLAPVYEEISVEGPAHSRVFTWSARVGNASRRVAAHSKKAARQLAAAALYRHLQDNLPEHLDSFDEEEALARAHERAMERYTAAAPERAMSALTMPLADYAASLSASIDLDRRAAALTALQTECEAGVEAAVEAAVAALGARLEPSELGSSVRVLTVTLSSAAPALSVASLAPHAPAATLRRLLLRLLRHPAPPAPAEMQPN